MQITANLRTFRAPWAVVVAYVRGGLDRDAFVGKKLTGADRQIGAAAIVVTGAPGRSTAPRLALHLAAATPEATVLPVRVAGNASECLIDFLETVDRYANADPGTRLRMAITESKPPHPKRLADLERELMQLREHTEPKRKGAPPDCVLAPSWSLAQAEQKELVRRRDARAALEYTLGTLLRELGHSPRYSMATLLARAAEENTAGEVSEATRGQLAELLRPGSGGDSAPERPSWERNATDPIPQPSVHEPERHRHHPLIRLRHPAAAWAKMVSAIEPKIGRGGFAFEGPFLHKAAQNDLPLASILLTGHDVGSRRHPRRERIASLVCIDADEQAIRIPMASDANRTDLDFRDYVALYLAMPPGERARRLLDALLGADPGPHGAITATPADERRLTTQYAEALRATISGLEMAGAADAAPPPGLDESPDYPSDAMNVAR